MNSNKREVSCTFKRKTSLEIEERNYPLAVRCPLPPAPFYRQVNDDHRHGRKEQAQHGDIVG